MGVGLSFHKFFERCERQDVNVEDNAMEIQWTHRKQLRLWRNVYKCFLPAVLEMVKGKVEYWFRDSGFGHQNI